MGIIDSFYITFDNPLATYYAGQAVTGKVTLKLNEDLSHKGIFIRFVGTAAVLWTETRSYYNAATKSTQYITITKSDSETYFKFDFPLMQPKTPDEKMKMNPGQYEFSFSQVLPVNLPTSMEGTYGRIRYVCSSNISRPWRFDTKCKAAFTVLELVDLNHLPEMGVPCSNQCSKTLGKCCWKAGSISASVSLNKKGFVPGEKIIISANVKNSSKKKINRTTADLVCIITYKVGSDKRVDIVSIAKVERGFIPPHGINQWVDQPLDIPSIHPTQFGAGLCRLITMEYFIRFTVVPSMLLTRNLEFAIPIVIGSIPLVNDFSRFFNSIQDVYPYEELGFRPPMLTEYPNLPPPTYAECFSGQVDIKEDDDEHAMGELTYAPRYLYYSQEPPPPYAANLI